MLVMMMNYVNLLVEFVAMSVSIRTPKNNNFTIIPTIYVQLGDAVDNSIQWCHVGTVDWVHG